MTANKKLQIFVSSTYTDLKDERQAAVEAILKAGHIPAGMELFSAGNESQLETIRRWIDQSDVYMLILGGRYGTVDTKSSLSYTELEYDYAVSKDIPVFSVVITDEGLDRKVAASGRSVLESVSNSELRLFREKVLLRISSFFTDSRDIKLAVHETLADFLARYEFSGWVSGSEVADTSALVEEIARLQKNNAGLEEQLKESRRSIDLESRKSNPKWADNEFDEIISLLNDIEISTGAFSEGEERLIIPVSRIMHAMRDRMITGIANKHDMEDVSSLLFFNVMPKLQVYGLAALEKVAGVQWQRYRLTDKGLALLAYIDRKKIEMPSGRKVEVPAKKTKAGASKATVRQKSS